MKDPIGNEIKEGMTLYWMNTGFKCRVIRMVEPKVRGNDAVPMMVIQLEIPLVIAPGQQFGFLAVVDPDVEKRVLSLVGQLREHQADRAEVEGG